MRLTTLVKADTDQLDNSLGSNKSKHRAEEAKQLTSANKLLRSTSKSKIYSRKNIKLNYVLVIILTFGLALTIISNFALTLVIHDHFSDPNKSKTTRTFMRKMPRNENNQSQILTNDGDDHKKLDFKNVVHIVHTRFMQNQPDLVHLAKARLELFQTVCLPSMTNQTTQNFVWIIFTDPKLNEGIKKEMIQLLSPYHNYIFVGDNHFPENFRNAKRLTKIKSENLYSGDFDILKESYKEAQNKLVLETRLDADDGLQHSFLEKIQYDVVETLLKNKRAQWMIWCLTASIEWSMKNPFPKLTASDRQIGYLLLVTENYCITPGLSIAYTSHIPFKKLPKLKHHILHKKARKCTHKLDVDCLKVLPRTLLALRARTPTSAGMQRVVIDGKTGILNPKAEKEQSEMQEKLLNFVNQSFAFDVATATSTKKSILNNIRAIAADNLKGQCTPGHSCKDTAKSILQKLASKNGE